MLAVELSLLFLVTKFTCVVFSPALVVLNLGFLPYAFFVVFGGSALQHKCTFGLSH